MYQLIVTSEARSDIDRNADWWAEHHSVEQAIAWTKAIYQQLESLRNLPESHTLSLENDAFDTEIREKLVGLGSRPRYRAVFTIKENNIYVLAVRAAEQDRLSPGDVDVE